MRLGLSSMVLVAALATVSPAPAADQPPQRQGAQGATGCAPGTRAEAATPPARNTADGTAPGNAGSTGWSGGTGGSHIGTNTSGALPSSPTWQPPTARGLDLLGTPERPASTC